MPAILATPAGWPRILLPAWDPTDPTDLGAAVREGAFEGLKRAVRDLGPTGATALVGGSGLRGRGGAGRLTAEKWRACASTVVRDRYVVGNGYEADPAVFTNRVLMEKRPYAVIEGLAIAALAVGAREAILAVRADYVEAVRRLEIAVASAIDAGFLGRDILGSGLSLSVSIRTVQGAYMLGEETVLLKALEGRRGQPEQRPPHPATRGLFGRPTLVHNVVTLAALPWIVTNGAEAFASIGAPDCPGTTLVQLSGSVADPGIVEVPMGTTLRELVRLGGSVVRGHDLKALVVGGPSGGILAPTTLDTPYTFDDLRAAGAHVGSGSVLVADERTNVLELAVMLTRYCADEACGKTIPCRIGLRRLSEIGARFVEGAARPTDPELLADLAHDIVESALCDHERLATRPLVSGMRYFAPEIEQHLASRQPAGAPAPGPGRAH
jgi:NADH:ubiquinone oxidoreductase subunit F (NADH-binding)